MRHLAPIIRDPAAPMINVAAGLISWSPFRKELTRWARKIDLFTDEDADMSSIGEPSEHHIYSKYSTTQGMSSNSSSHKSSYRYQPTKSSSYGSYTTHTNDNQLQEMQSSDPSTQPSRIQQVVQESTVPSTSTGTFNR